MRILAIETSADETAMSLLETRNGETFELLAHDVASQIKLHTEYGGIVPMLAKREHQANLPLMLSKIFPNLVPSTCQLAPGLKPDLIAVTYGPGLEPALWTGINFAQDLAAKWDVPIVATDHMHGHIVSALLNTTDGKTYIINKPEFPAIALLISGGHTQLVLMHNLENFEVLGQTVDDSVGEAFDKVARMLGLPYPGGPEIEKLAARSKVKEAYEVNKLVKLPRPMLHSKDLNFSFSGLKTAVLYLIKKLKEENKTGELSDEQKIAIAHEFIESCKEVLVKKTENAIRDNRALSLLAGGGVIASKPIREALRDLVSKLEVELYLPDNKFTGDNATMIGIAGYLHSKAGTVNTLSPNSPELASLKATGNLALYK